MVARETWHKTQVIPTFVPRMCACGKPARPEHMILCARNLRMIFQVLYGYRWAVGASDGLHKGLRTIRRWTGPGGRAPANARGLITTAIDAKIADLEQLKSDLR